MAYSELIKNFEKVRAYMREFYVYGFKSRTEYDAKSARSYYMVDHADFLLAVYDNNRKLRSGTGQTVNYALKQNLRIIFLHPDTAEIS